MGCDYVRLVLSADKTGYEFLGSRFGDDRVRVYNIREVRGSKTETTVFGCSSFPCKKPEFNLTIEQEQAAKIQYQSAIRAELEAANKLLSKIVDSKKIPPVECMKVRTGNIDPVYFEVCEDKSSDLPEAIVECSEVDINKKQCTEVTIKTTMPHGAYIPPCEGSCHQAKANEVAYTYAFDRSYASEPLQTILKGFD